MEEKVVSALTESPFLLAMIVLVWMFGRYLAGRDASAKAERAEFLTMFHDVQRENITAREASRQVIERNTIEATRNTEALQQLSAAIKDLVRIK